MAGAAHVAMRKFLSWLIARFNGDSPPWVVIIGRLLVGYAVGTITGVAPVFGAEIAKVSLAAGWLLAVLLERREADGGLLDE
jgi:hypothetical protein